MGDVAELVGEDRLELLGGEAALEAARHTHDRLRRAPAGGEGVRDVEFRHGDLRHGHVSEGGESLDDLVELRLLVLGDEVATHAEERDLVGVEVLHEEEDRRDDDHGERADADGDEQSEEQDVHQPEEEDGEGHPCRQPAILGKASRSAHTQLLHPTPT